MSDMLIGYIKWLHADKMLHSETIITNLFINGAPTHGVDEEIVKQLSANVANNILYNMRADITTEERPNLNGKRIMVSCFCFTTTELDQMITAVFEMGKIAAQEK